MTEQQIEKAGILLTARHLLEYKLNGKYGEKGKHISFNIDNEYIAKLIKYELTEIIMKANEKIEKLLKEVLKQVNKEFKEL